MTYNILVSGKSNVDGIITAPFAKSLNAPILLVESDTVINELKNLSVTTERVYGNTRYTTAIAVAKKVGNFNKLIICNSKDGAKNVPAVVGLAAQKNIINGKKIWI